MLLWERGMKTPSPPGIFPVRFMDVHMQRSARDQFVSQMWGYGEAYGFRMLVKNYRAKPDDMFFQMWLPDVDLLASNDSDTGATDLKIGIGFYPKRGQPPPSPENIAPLVEGLRRFLDKVPGVVIEEKAPRQ